MPHRYLKHVFKTKITLSSLHQPPQMFLLKCSQSQEIRGKKTIQELGIILNNYVQFVTNILLILLLLLKYLLLILGKKKILHTSI